MAAQQLADAAEALRNSVGRRRGAPVGRVRLSVPVPLGLSLSNQLRPLLDRYRELSLDLVLRDRTSDLIDENLDLEVRVGPIADSSLIARRIGSTTAFVVAAPRYLSDRSAPTHPRDLQEHDCIVYHMFAAFGRESEIAIYLNKLSDGALLYSKEWMQQWYERHRETR